MAAFRLYSKMDTFFGNTGQLLAGGWITFEDAGTDTPKDVFGDIDLATNNGSTVGLDSSGRPNVDVWGEGDYFAEFFDSLGVKQGEVDHMQIPGGASESLPALGVGQFYTSDGSQILATDIRQVPDPTGQGGKILGNDGEALIWQAPPAAGADGVSDVSDTATGFTVGDQALVTGSDTAPNVGGKSTTKAVVFATPFASAPAFIGIEPTGSAYSPSGGVPAYTITARSAAGFTVAFTLGEQDDTQASYNFNATVPFNYVAVGVKA